MSRLPSYTIEVPDKLIDLELKIKVQFHEEAKFLKILKLANLTIEDLRESLDLEKNKHQVFKAGHGSGMSGSFFFFSKDGRFIIKTI